MSPGMRREDSKEKREGEERVLVDGCQACKSKRGIDGKQAPPPFPLQNFRRFQSFLKLVFFKKYQMQGFGYYLKQNSNLGNVCTVWVFI